MSTASAIASAPSITPRAQSVIRPLSQARAGHRARSWLASCLSMAGLRFTAAGFPQCAAQSAAAAVALVTQIVGCT